MTDRPLSFRLHLGAHRTGSTRLQAALDAHADLLARRGAAVLTPPRPGKRGGETIRAAARRAARVAASGFLPKRLLERHKLTRTLARLLPDDARQVVISEENFLGDIFSVDGSGFYDEARGMLGALVSALPGHVETVCLAIRPYDDFLVSSYAMTAVYRPLDPPLRRFSELKPALVAFRRGWPELVGDIAEVFGNARLEVWIGPTLPLAAQLSLLLGDELSEGFAVEELEIVNAAPTAEAVERGRLARQVRGASPDEIVERFRGGTPFDPLTAEEREGLRSRFAFDVRRLSERRGLRLHGPAPEFVDTARVEIPRTGGK